MTNQVIPREQLGVCAEGNLHSVYLMFSVNESVDELLRPCLANIAQEIHDLSDQYVDSAFNGFVAIGANYWHKIYPQQQPALLKPFPVMSSAIHKMPATEFDLFIHLRCDRIDILHEVATNVCEMLDGLAELTEEERGFRFMDNRDLTGFVDGTENPKGRHRQEVALVGEEEQLFAGGSYVHVQKYQHKLTKWKRLPVKKQEDIIGRTKQDNIEYESENKPLTAHIRRVNLKDQQGNAMEILRQSMPYGLVKDQGLMFISCCKTPVHFEKMLHSMVFGDADHGGHDHLINFTQALTGASFFAPSLDFMLQFGE